MVLKDYMFDLYFWYFPCVYCFQIENHHTCQHLNHIFFVLSLYTLYTYIKYTLSILSACKKIPHHSIILLYLGVKFKDHNHIITSSVVSSKCLYNYSIEIIRHPFPQILENNNNNKNTEESLVLISQAPTDFNERHIISFQLKFAFYDFDRKTYIRMFAG